MSDLPPILREATGHRGAFFMDRDGERLASLTFSAGPDGKIVILDHTEVFSESLKGKDVGRKLVAASVEWARQAGVKLVPVCPFAKAIFDRVPEYRDVLA